MNFRLNKWKIILVLLILLIIGGVGYSLTRCVGNPCTFEIKLMGTMWGLIYFGIPLVLIIYTIWSLIEKKK